MRGGDTGGMNILQTPLFIREYESALSAVRAEIFREAPDCEVVQLTDEIVIFGSCEEVTESTLRRGLDVWNVQHRKREERWAKQEAAYMEYIYRCDEWRARMVKWLEEQDKTGEAKSQRRKQVVDRRWCERWSKRAQTSTKRGMAVGSHWASPHNRATRRLFRFSGTPARCESLPLYSQNFLSLEQTVCMLPFDVAAGKRCNHN